MPCRLAQRISDGSGFRLACLSWQSLSIATALAFPHQLRSRFYAPHFMRRTVGYGPPSDGEACADSRQPALSPAMPGPTRAFARNQNCDGAPEIGQRGASSRMPSQNLQDCNLKTHGLPANKSIHGNIVRVAARRPESSGAGYQFPSHHSIFLKCVESATRTKF